MPEIKRGFVCSRAHLRVRRRSRRGLRFRHLTHIFFDCYLRNQKDCFLVALFRVVLDVLENQVKSSSKCRVIGDTNALTSVGLRPSSNLHSKMTSPALPSFNAFSEA